MNDFKKLKMVKKLSELKENGIIDDAEFENRKEKILHRKPFWSKDKIIIFTCVTIIIIVISVLAAITHYNASVQEESKKEAQVAARASSAAEQVQREKYLDIIQKESDLGSLVFNEYGNFENSAFGQLYYINFPDHYNDWNSQLNTMKNDLSKYVAYTNQEINIPPAFLKEIGLNVNSDKILYESRYNDFVIIIKNYNKRLSDYNSWATNYIKLGNKTELLDPYPDGGYSNEIDFNNDGKKDSLEQLTT
jgi:type II secretory pathway pseudopilin PulG